MPGALLTDLYELNMAASYLRRGMTAEATFSLYVRDLPPERGFAVVGGLARCLDFLEGFGFDAEARNAAKKAKFSPATKDGVPVKMWTTLRIVF